MEELELFKRWNLHAVKLFPTLSNEEKRWCWFTTAVNGTRFGVGYARKLLLLGLGIDHGLYTTVDYCFYIKLLKINIINSSKSFIPNIYI